MVGAFMVIPLAWARVPVSVIAIIVLSPFKIIFMFMALSGDECPEALLTIGLSTHDIY
jgi:hypothetical protein